MADALREEGGSWTSLPMAAREWRFSSSDFTTSGDRHGDARSGGYGPAQADQGPAPETNVVIITAHGSVGQAVEAMQEGAVDFIAKPFSMAQLSVRLDNVCAVRQLRAQNVRLQEQLEAAQLLRSDDRQEQGHAGGLRSDPPRRDLGCVGTHLRRKRDRQGDGGVGDPLQLAAAGQALRSGQLCLLARNTHRVGALWLRAWALHGQRDRESAASRRPIAEPCSSTKSVSCPCPFRSRC